MPEIQETFDLLKNYIEELPIGLLLFNEQKKIVSWNSAALKLLEQPTDNLKRSDLGIVTNQIDEILNNEQLVERELIGLLKPYKMKKVVTNDKNIILIITHKCK